MTTDPEVGRSIVVGGVDTNYHDVGEGPVLLMLHGSGPGVSAWANWRGVIPDLATRFRVIAPDLLGFGRTRPSAEQTYDISSWMDHLHGFIDALGLEQLSVVGNSFGGGLALRVAISRPDAVTRLVVMGSVGVPSTITPGLEAVWGFTPSFENMRRLLDIFAFDSSRATDELAKLRLAAATRSGVHEAYAQMFRAPRQRALDEMNVPEADLKSITQPTLILHGRDDRVIPLSNSIALNALIDDSQLHVFGRCGHWVQIEEREGFVELVSRFVAAEAHS
ncbi:alpha/beta fold hydrolase [Agreia sp.]|uniref:alpha/beta fold hydrolase n=1 Tax=Agreia sp. TaxID=1872416 RepID=UPI0035BBE0D2